MPLPLEGIRVLDLTRILAGPFATQRLGDLGADVIKVENPDGGDDTRGWGPPFKEGVSTYFFAVNRNKRSVAIDLKREAGKALLIRLLERADVVVENFRPGTLERLGFGWEALRERFPRLIYCSISGYGHRSRHRDRPSYDVVIQGEAGAMDVTGFPDGPPTKVGLSIADLVAGLYAVEGILAALFARERTGRGDRVDIALFDSLLSLLAYQGQMWLACGQTPRRLGNAHPSLVPYETYRARDGWVIVGVGSELLWARFCEAIGRPEWIEDPRFRTNKDRVENRRALVPMIEARLLEAGAAEWYDRLSRAGVPCGRVRTVAEALEEAREDIRGLIVEVEHPEAGRVAMVGNPVHLAAAGPGPLRPPPRLGEHTGEVLRDLGIAPEEIARLRQEGTIA
jgi:formyl-CoA transferase